MGLNKLAKKLADYNERLDCGKVEKIQKTHVEKILKKLNKKIVQLDTEIASEENSEKKGRLQRKLDIAQEHINRAEWLLAQLE